MKKKTLFKLLLSIFFLAISGIAAVNSVQASVITLKASTKRSYYNVKPKSVKSIEHWTNSPIYKNMKINHGKISYNYVGMCYSVKGLHLQLAINQFNHSNTHGDTFKKGYVYVNRTSLRVTHLKPNQKYRFRVDYDENYTDFNQYHWVTEKANSKGVIKYGPQVDVYMNCGKSRTYMRKIMKHKTRISNSRINLL